MAFGCKWSFVVMKSEGKYKPAIKDGRYLVDNIFFDKKTIFNFYFANIISQLLIWKIGMGITFFNTNES